MSERNRLPCWLKKSPLNLKTIAEMQRLAGSLCLHTVCQSARCPNRQECFAGGTATFMILGDICTRDCAFCAVKHGEPQAPDHREPEHIVAAVDRLGLRYVVLTSVTRDDLPDGGAGHFARAIEAIHSHNPNIRVEVLIPDFQGCLSALKRVVAAAPVVLNHNLETVPRLYSSVRPQADYRRSLGVLKGAKRMSPSILTKSGLMAGLGESRDEIVGVMHDLREAGCDFLTIGQYLPPSHHHHAVARYVAPEEFRELAEVGKGLGFRDVASAPLVRSSYHAAEMIAAPLP